MTNIPVAILGATGYTGAELIRLIDGHPHFSVAHLGAHSQAGKPAGSVLPGCAGHIAEMTLAAADAPLADDIELVFTALPHAAAANSVAHAGSGVGPSHPIDITMFSSLRSMFLPCKSCM